MKCFVVFRLKDGVSYDDYVDWFQHENVPAVRQMASVQSYRVWRITRASEGKVDFEILEEMEIDDAATFEAEIERQPAMSAMLEGWYGRVADQAIVYADEIPQTSEGQGP